MTEISDGFTCELKGKNPCVCGGCCTRIIDLCVQMNGKKILENINLHIHCGELTVITGPNGAGKSTLLKAIMGAVKFSGKMQFPRKSKPTFGYVPQSQNFDKGTPMSVCDLFVCGATNHPVFFPLSSSKKHKIKDALEVTGASQLLNRSLGVLSGGEVQRVLLALAIFQKSPIIILDEPVSGYDVSGLKEFYKLIDQIRRTQDTSIIMVSHDTEFIRNYADRVILLHHKVVLSGTPEFVLGSKEYELTMNLG